MNVSGMSEFDDGPIVPWTTTAFSFPTVAHVCCAAGHDQVVTMTEEHVATGKYEPAVFYRREIDVARALKLIPIGYDFAIDAQPRYAAIGEDLETKMRDSFVVLNGKGILRVATKRHLRQ